MYNVIYNYHIIITITISTVMMVTVILTRRQAALLSEKKQNPEEEKTTQVWESIYQIYISLSNTQAWDLWIKQSKGNHSWGVHKSEKKKKLIFKNYTEREVKHVRI